MANKTLSLLLPTYCYQTLVILINGKLVTKLVKAIIMGKILVNTYWVLIKKGEEVEEESSSTSSFFYWIGYLLVKLIQNEGVTLYYSISY